MRTIYLNAAVLLGLLAGCSADQAPDGAGSIAVGRLAASKVATPSDGVNRASTGFASLPDRGELLAYDPVRRVKRSGAYTAYPVALSEQHALRAMQSGELVVNAPDGELIRLKFERHVEHADGNWSWIGRNADGADAVLTFGEKAVFGSIPQGADDALQLTMRAGQSYLVTTDRSRLGGVGGTVRRRGPDVLIPPQAAGTSNSMPTTASSVAEPVTESATAAAAVVDVLLGYSNGFASQLGGQSQANTRLVNMIDIANQAYANSGIGMRVRLVKTLQVTYPDNTDSGDALEKLTGYKSGSGGGPITPDPAFNALRAARDTYGADLVSLVRAFRTPENDGCGIAWLIGGGQSGFDTGSAPFGYSVVSDGTDFDEGDNQSYFCRDETLVHELGHNMGQAHNSDIADGPGVHAYSYGYRESSTTGFYTIMAYRLDNSSQFSIRHFANPGINYAGRPTGVANASDNARSMNQTMPIAAGFRGTVVPNPNPNPDTDVATHDFDGDGVSDVLWRNIATGANTIWKAANIRNQQAMSRVGNLAWEMVGVGDFNGDGRDDVLWRNSASGANTIWRSGNAAAVQAVSGVASQAWKVVGIGDFNGDGVDDILWRHSGTGANTIWKSANRSTQQSMTQISDTNWTVVGVGDFNADGKSDILWRHLGSGSGVIWYSGSYSTRQAVTRIRNLAWKVVGVGDFNQDGVADILWRNDKTGGNVIWRSGNYGSQQGVRSVSNLHWQIEATGDYDADGVSDILWRNDATGVNVIWRGADYRATQSMGTVQNLYWQVRP